jgi:hypothetical protein
MVTTNGGTMIYNVADYDTAHKIVEDNKFLEWDGYDITTWRKNPGALMDRRGAFRDGAWGLLYRYPLQDDGTWNIPEIYYD